jgi:8-amino-7-oxononanoate synthase
VVDFTSSLYLGLEHAWSSLRPWDRLTLGKPAALEEMEGAAGIERELAALVGCEAAVLGTSTLHLVWDLFGILAESRIRIFVDEGSYPIARWGVERALAAGAPVRSFPRHDVRVLRAMLDSGGGMPVVVTDGFFPAIGKAAPLAEYADCAAAEGGLLVVDDTQALGIFGRYGGGSLAALKPRGGVVAVSSLAKAFGAPVAMLGGTARFVAEFRERSATRMHCSPPSAAALAAARHALDCNRAAGDLLRRRLTHRVARFREGLRPLGLLGVPGCFPVQPLRLPTGVRAKVVYRRLLSRGVRTVLHRTAGGGASRISFILTARLRLSQIARALRVLELCVFTR